MKSGQNPYGLALIGLGHYTAPGTSELAWWRHAHIWAGIACGAAVLAFAVWSVRRERVPAARPRD